MWIFTPLGFFSIVRKRNNVDLTIRARVRTDLEALREYGLPELTTIIDHQGTDYPYRALVPAAAWARVLAQLAENIDYDNFKDEVARKQGKARALSYRRVWSALYDLETQLRKG